MTSGWGRIAAGQGWAELAFRVPGIGVPGDLDRRLLKPGGPVAPAEAAQGEVKAVDRSQHEGQHDPRADIRVIKPPQHDRPSRQQSDEASEVVD
jgi:hypothetical protein